MNRLTQLAFRPHLPRRTVRLRLTLLYGGLFLVSGAALLAVTYVLVVHATSGFIFESQDGKGGAVVTTHSGSGGRSGSGERPQLTAKGPGAAGLTPRQIEAQAKQFEAQARRQHASVLHQLLLQSAIALGAMALASIALGWIVAGRVLRPLRTITAAARDISATNLHERLALDGPDDELKELGDTFDELLTRLDASFQAQRRFVANASHELRTPLARQRTVGQVAIADPHATVESLRAAHLRVLASGAEQERLIDALLTLTRGQAGLDRREDVDLMALTERVVDAARPEADARDLALRAALSPAAMTGDPRLVERLIANLVENGLRHNVPGGRVEITTESDGGRAVVAVRNTGPVVPESAVQRLLQPFQRLGAERTRQRGGLGLGLSIVQAIADAHGATLALRPQADGGLEVTVSFAAALARPATAPVPHAPAPLPRVADAAS